MKPSLESILDVVLESFDVKRDFYETISKTRVRLAVDIRQAICYLGQRFSHSQNTIGKFLNINHSTVCCNRVVVTDRCSIDEEFANKIYKSLDILQRLEQRQSFCFINGWITRDENGDLTLFSEKPDRDRYVSGEGFWYGECPRELDPSLFPQITWDDEPKECKITLTLE